MTSRMHLNTAAQLDRACGAVLGAAAGDALGAGYEFGCATVGPDGPQMIGGGLGNFAPGEWTDDTTMAWCILEAAADPTTHDLRSDAALDRIARNFRDWYDTNPPDIGNQTRTVLRQAGENPTGATMVATAYDLHQRTGHTGGNGSLMRTNPVAVAHLDDATAAAEAARRISDLTHYDPDAGDACVLWTLAIRHAILTGELDVRVGLPHLTPEATDRWTHLIREAEVSDPKSFSRNGWVVGAFQAAWSAIVHTPVPDVTNQDAGMPCAHLPAALATAIGIGHDTDTVAAIAGGLLGARWGASAVPAKWRRLLHGYPGITGERLVELATLAARGGKPLANGWPGVERMDYTAYTGGHVLVRHPHDDGVWLGDVDALDALEDLAADVTAVVSLCLVGSAQVPEGVEHVSFRLIDRAEPEENPNLAFVLRDAAETVAALRDQGHVVLVHCVAAQSRTPAVAIAYALLRGVSKDDASREVLAALPHARPNRAFRAALEHLADETALDPRQATLTLLRAVAVLHARGAEQVRVSPGMAPSGMYWRLTVAPASDFDPAHAAGHQLLPSARHALVWSTGGLPDFHGLTLTARTTAEQVADHLATLLPAAEVAGPDPAYKQWYAGLLAASEAAGSPAIAFSDSWEPHGWRVGGRDFEPPPAPRPA